MAVKAGFLNDAERESALHSCSQARRPFIQSPLEEYSMLELDSVRTLRDKGVDFRLLELKQRAVSVEDVIKYSISEIDVDEICKTILLKDSAGDRHAVFLLGSHRIDFTKVKAVIGRIAKIATFEEVKAATNVEPGAICPILLSLADDHLVPRY